MGTMKSGSWRMIFAGITRASGNEARACVAEKNLWQMIEAAR
jgi:hypothetical protein